MMGYAARLTNAFHGLMVRLSRVRKESSDNIL